MNKEEVLELYGLDPDTRHRQKIRELLQKEIENQEEVDHEYLKTLCIMLFCIGNVEDTRLIRQAKRNYQDTGSYIDVQLLCGARYEKTVTYLEQEARGASGRTVRLS